MTAIEYFDRLEPGWFALEVMRRRDRSRDWVALMVDVDPDEFANTPTARQRWLIIPGKHRDRDAAWDALDEMFATRH